MSGLTQLFNGNKGRAARIARAAAAFASRLRHDRRGNILTIFAISLPLMIGGLGIGVEGANWYQTKRALQNAADEAVVAAATNNSSNYLDEARAVTAKYGYTDGSANVSVTASNAATCPTGGSTCYSVTITKKLPLIFSRYLVSAGTQKSGAATQSSSLRRRSRAIKPVHAIIVSSRSRVRHLRQRRRVPDKRCTKGGSDGCSIMSNASMDCNGHNLLADYGDAHGTNSGCGIAQTSNVSAVSDPYARWRRISRRTPARATPRNPRKKADPPSFEQPVSGTKP